MKNKLILSFIVLLVAVSVLAVSAQDATTVDDVISERVSDDNALSIDGSEDGQNDVGGADEIWVDDATYNHIVHVSGEFKVIDHQNQSSVKEYNSTTESTKNGEYSNWTAFDDNLINEYIDSVLKILGYYDNPLKIITKEVSVVSNDTDDNRTYRTEYVTSNPNNFALDGDLTVEHIIEGNYTNVVYYAIKFVAEYNLDEDAPVENNTANDTQNTTNDTNATQNSTSDTNNASNTTNESIAINAADNDGDKNITDNTNIDSKDVAKATGIPFAVLVAALLGVGVSIRRRK